MGERSVFEGGRAEGEGVFQAEEEEREEKGEESCVKLVVFIFVSFTGAEGRWGVLNFFFSK